MGKSAIGFLIFILVTMFSSSLVFSQEDLVGKSYLILDSDIDSSVEAKALTERSNIDHIITDLYFYPKASSTLEVLSFNAKNGGRIHRENIEWVWTPQHPNQLNFGVESTLKSYPLFVPIQESSFPLSNLDLSLQQYLVDTEHIDASNPKIINLASSLATGETDQFKVVSKLAYWSRQNIAYNLSTLTTDVSQKASWVLEHKKGVCDELTNLFIALNRALGIPARFVSGISYTNSDLFGEPWNPHGWAEVYFPEHGWIPFDTTYGQYGWVDATHIKMRESSDPQVPSTQYEWRGQDITLETQQLSFTTHVKEVGEDLPALVDIEVAATKPKIGFGAHNLISARIVNTQDFSLATEVTLFPSEEIILLDDKSKLVFLGPHETQRVYWKIKTVPTLSTEYKYAAPLIVSTTRNEKANTSFEIASHHAYYTKEDIDQSYLYLAQEDEKVYSQEVDLYCYSQDEQIYEDQTTHISCYLKNLGNVYLENLDVCLQERCISGTDLGIGQTKEIVFPLSWHEQSNKVLEIIVTNKDITKAFSVDLERLDLPDLEIVDVTAPLVAKFEDSFTVEFSVKRTSVDPPKDVLVTFSRGKVTKDWEIPELHEQRFAITLYAEDFDSVTNTFGISASFVNPRGEVIEKKTSVKVRLDKSTVSFQRRVKMVFNKWVNWVESWF